MRPPYDTRATPCEIVVLGESEMYFGGARDAQGTTHEILFNFVPLR